MKAAPTDRALYSRLRKHFNALPIGFPKSESGMRILKRLFNPAEARLALAMDWRFLSAQEIEQRLAKLAEAPELGLQEIRSLLDGMAAKGSILRRAEQNSYALMPFVVGMYELQIGSLSKEFVEDTIGFLKEGYGLELLAGGEPQSRIIPIGAAIKPEHKIANYDEFRSLILNAGDDIAVLPCVCRKAADLAGKPCRSTERRELCIVFRDYAHTVVREGWGRAISQKEALELADLNQAEGLIMRPSAEAEPQFLCACCGDCCGLIGVVKAVKRPADFVSSNFRATINADACRACGACLKVCPMQAIDQRGQALSLKSGAKRRAARVDSGRCIGCGVCVPSCAFKAIELVRKQGALEPPQNTEELLERMESKRPTLLRKIYIGIRAILGIAQDPRRPSR